MKERVIKHFESSIKIKQQAAKIMSSDIVKAGEQLATCLQQNKKILICGNGGSAADAQHMAAELIGRFECERPSLAAIALTTDSSILTAVSNDYSYEEIFEKQVNGLGQSNDVLVAFSTSGNSQNVIRAIQAAHRKMMSVIALTGKDGGQIAKTLNNIDIELRVPSYSIPRIQEIHLLTLHCICDLIDQRLFSSHISSNVKQHTL